MTPTQVTMDFLLPPRVDRGDVPSIPGLSYYPDYISFDEENRLIAAIDELPWDTTWDRRRQPYGGGYGEPDSSAPPIPPFGAALAERMFREGLSTKPFDQMLVNEYLPGQGIASHTDYQTFDRIVVSLSLLSACVMDFREVDGGRTESLLLEPRSLLVLTDDARYRWEHGIARRKSDRWKGAKIARGRRVSITFRLQKSTEPAADYS